MPIIYVTDYINDPDLERDIAATYGYDVKSGAIGPQDEAQIEALLAWHQNIDASYIKKFPNLRVVVRYGVGFDSVNLEDLRAHNITFANTPDYGTDEVSDTAIGMMLCAARGITQAQRIVAGLNDGSWQENVIPRIRRTKDMRLGIIGLGRIGTAAALKAHAIGFQVSFFDPFVSRGMEKSLNLKRHENLKECLGESDVISLHLPLSDQTSGLVDGAFINNMKPGSSLINTARGGLIASLDDIFTALDRDHLAFAGLDVIPEEPLLPSHPQHAAMLRLMKTGRLVVNPHTAYYSQEALREMRTLASSNAVRFLAGIAPLLNRIC